MARRNVCAVVALICAGASVTSAGPEDLRSIHQAFGLMGCAKFSAAVEEVRTSALRNEPLETHYRVQCIRDSDRWGFSRSRMSSLSEPNAERLLRNNFVYRDGEGVQFNWVSDATGKLRRDGDFAGLFLSPRVSAKPDYPQKFWPTDGGFDPVVFGVMDGQEILSSGGLLANSELEREGDFVVVHSETRFGRLSAWCDPAHGYLPRRLEFVQSPDNLSKGRRIGDIEMMGGNVWPAGKINEKRWTVENEFARDKSSGNRPYIASWRLTQQVDCAAGVVVSRVVTCKVESVAFDQKFRDEDLLFGLDLPRMFPLTVVGAEHLRYVWDGQWAVPRAEALTGTDLRAPRRRFVLYFITAALVFLVAGILALRATRLWRPNRRSMEQ